MSLLNSSKDKGNGSSKKNESRIEYAAVSTSNDHKEIHLTSEKLTRLIMVLAVVSLILSVIPIFSVTGFLLGIALLIGSWYMKTKIGVVPKKASMIIAACAVLFGLVIGCTSLATNANSKEAATVPPETTQKESAGQDPAVAESPELKVSVSGATVSGLNTIQVVVTGTTTTGVAINDTRTLLVPQTNTLGYPAGKYTISCAAFTAPDGKTMFKAASVSGDYAEESSQTLVLKLENDTEEMQRIAAEQEAARVAAEQEAARVAAEQQAAAKAAAEAAAAQEAASATEAEHTVYVTKTGEKYHSSGCQYLSKSKIPISESQAISKGYTPCSRCNP